jgi:hypothetical protein
MTILKKLKEKIMRRKNLFFVLAFMFSFGTGINAQIVDEPSVRNSGIAYNNVSKPNIYETSFKRGNSTFQVLEQPGKVVMFYSDNIFTLSYMNEDQKATYLILKDDKGNVLYESDNMKSPVVHSRLVLKSFPAGEYSAEFYTKGARYEKSFVIGK